VAIGRRELAAASLLLALLSILACWPLARRASNTDPVAALKTE
jgi:ABC-type lipoprotein release transport system permease subunit